MHFDVNKRKILYDVAIISAACDHQDQGKIISYTKNSIESHRIIQLIYLSITFLSELYSPRYLLDSRHLRL